MKGLFESENKLYVRKVYKNAAGTRKYICRRVQSRTDARNVMCDIENDLAHGTESFENCDSLNSYLERYTSSGLSSPSGLERSSK